MRRTVTIGAHRVSVEAGAAIYEIDGRLLARTEDWTSGPGLERAEVTVLDGYPDVDPARVGELVISAAARSRRIDLPSSWPGLLEHAQPLLDASPGRFRSFRSWQRRARHVTVGVRRDGVHVARLHPDLGRGSWEGRPADTDRHDGHPQSVVVPLPTDVASVGLAVVDVLGEPPISS